MQWMRELGADSRSRDELRALRLQIIQCLQELGGHAALAAVIDRLDAQIDADMAFSAAERADRSAGQGDVLGSHTTVEPSTPESESLEEGP